GAEGRRRRFRRVAGLPRKQRSALGHAAANQRLLSPAAIPIAGVRVGRHGGARCVHGRDRKRRPIHCPRAQALKQAQGTAMKINQQHVIAPAIVILLLGSYAAHAADDLDKVTMEVIKSSFRSQGQAKVEWLDQDAVQKACSAATPPAADEARKMEAEQLATVKWPSDGKYLGDWKAGEKMAQSGRGMT